MELTSIILAAGKGTRMKSKTAKVLHEICFKPILHYPIKLSEDLGCGKVVVVIGHQEDDIRKSFSDRNVTFATQAEQLGTGHAALCALDKLDDKDNDILILCGDTPLLTKETVTALFNAHIEKGAALSILTSVADDPTGYGRIVCDESGRRFRIVEEKDASDDEKFIDEVNTGTYIVKRDFLCRALKKLKNENAQKEYYLTDIVSIAANEGETVATHTTDDFSEGMGINTREDLATAGMIKRYEINRRYMLDGVTIIDPDTTYIEEGVEIGCDVIIHPGVIITGRTVIDTGANILPYCVVEDSVLEADVSVGPFARLRPGTVIKKNAKIGNFVEIKKSTIGEGSKAGHLTYLGDTTLGRDVNIGAGTITCNYDGKKKHKTVIEDGAFIGSNSALVAPVTVRKGALVGAGAVITKDVPENTVAIERSQQKHYPKTEREQ